MRRKNLRLGNFFNIEFFPVIDRNSRCLRREVFWLWNHLLNWFQWYYFQFFTSLSCDLIVVKEFCQSCQTQINSTPSHNAQLKPKPHYFNILNNWIDINSCKILNKVSIWLNSKPCYIILQINCYIHRDRSPYYVLGIFRQDLFLPSKFFRSWISSFAKPLQISWRPYRKVI